MAGSTGGASSSNPSAAPPPPKILLAKPGLVTTGSVSGKLVRGGGVGGGAEDETVSRSRLPPIGSLNILSDSWEFHTDRFLPFLTENTDFTVIGVIGPPGVGKSTILNELYGFDGSSPGMLPPFAIQSEDNRALARHCTIGIEPRISAERLILLDTQSVFSPSVLAEMMRPDGSSTIPVLGGESLSAELAHELMGIQVDLLKHGIPDPSWGDLSHLQSSNLGPDKENKEKVQGGGEDYMAAPIFVCTKVRDQDLTPRNIFQLKKELVQYFRSSSFMRANGNPSKEHLISSLSSVSSDSQSDDSDSKLLNLFTIPFKSKDDSPRAQYESYNSMLWRLRDQVLSMNTPSFARTVSEREWLKNSAKIWELVKNSPIIAEYSRTLQSSGLFRR